MGAVETAWAALARTVSATQPTRGTDRVRWTGRALFRLLGGISLGVAVVALLLVRWLWGLGEWQFFILLGGLIGLVPGVVHLPNGPFASAPPARRRFARFIMPLLALSICAWDVASTVGRPSRFRFEKNALIAQLLVVTVTTPIATLCMVRRSAPSTYVHDATWCVVTAWVNVLLESATHALLASARLKGLMILLHGVALHLDGLVIIWNACLLVHRLKALSPRTHVGVKYWRPLLGLMGLGFYLSRYFDFAVHQTVGDDYKWVTMPPYLLLSATFAATYIFYTGSIIACLVRSALVLRREAARLQGAPRAEAEWAMKVLCCEIAGCIAGVMTTTLWSLLVLHRSMVWVWHGDVCPWLRMLVRFGHKWQLLSIITSVALLSGLLWQPKLPVAKDVRKPSRPCHTRLARDLADAAKESDWAAKVEELAGRGFSLGHLLDFWEALTQHGVMPSFDPRRSTTNDVVRQAIIPLSRNGGASGYGGRALATVWSQGQRVQAKRMVTHNWSNLFSHLVAGIVADALGEEYYARVAADLLRGAEGLRAIRAAVESQGLSGEAYWVCAFSVNQHAGICAGFGPPPPPGTERFSQWDASRRDTATGEVFPVCSCGELKFFNDDPARCEMDKFDAMMRLLSERTAGFSHLVVVDASFDLFGRAWCIAEIVESSMSGIPQRIMLHSREQLDLHYHRLASVDVADCKASREGDKEMILARICDRDAFNDQLQWAIFGTEGLFSKWLDGQERAAEIGRIVARAQHDWASTTSDGEGSSDDGWGGAGSSISTEWTDNEVP